MTDIKKAKHEIEVFDEFIINSVLANEWNDGADSCCPPKPDILFRSKNNPRYFELGRIADDEMVRTTLKALYQAPVPVTPNIEKINLPEREVLKNKLSKTYDSDELPIELILYLDCDSKQPYLQGCIPPIDFIEHANFVMAPLLQESMGAFSRIWVFERYNHTVLWTYPACSPLKLARRLR